MSPEFRVQTPSPHPQAPSSDTTLFLIRHAHAVWTPDDRRSLSALGTSAAVRIAALLEQFPVTAIYSSPSRRAIETVAPLAERLRLDPILIDDLRERELSAASAPQFEAAIERSWQKPHAAATEGGESNVAAQGRGIALLRSVLERHPGETVVISTHGSLFALMLNGFDARFEYDFWRSLTFPDVYELVFAGQTLLSVRRLWQPEE